MYAEYTRNYINCLYKRLFSAKTVVTSLCRNNESDTLYFAGVRTTSNNDSRRSSCEIYLRVSSKRLAHIFRVVADYTAGTTFLSVVTQPHILLYTR